LTEPQAAAISVGREGGFFFHFHRIRMECVPEQDDDRLSRRPQILEYIRGLSTAFVFELGFSEVFPL